MKNNPIINTNGDTVWRNSIGQFHRIDGPAIIWKDGYEWWLNDVRHRLDGPALSWSDGTELWFINGKEVDPIPKHIILWESKLKEEQQ